MARYKVRIPSKGDHLYDEDGTISVVADSPDEAKDWFEDWDGDRPEFVHSEIGFGRVVYKRDVEAGDTHEDAEPGDTTFDVRKDDGGELRPNEVRLWKVGPWKPWWTMEPLAYEGRVGWRVTVHNEIVGERETMDECYALRDEKVAEHVEAWKARQKVTA